MYRRSLLLTVLFMLVSTAAHAQRISVSRYPAQLRDTYQLFRVKCSSCHDLASTINSDYVLPSYYRRMVNEMQQMEDSGITRGEADRIYEFLVYDAFERRKRELREQLRPLPKEKQKEEKDKIRQVLKRYKK